MTPLGDVIGQFAEALRARDIIPPRIVADGHLHRCDAAGRHGKGDAAYLLHVDGIPAGGFENWRDGRGWQPWRADVERELTEAERAAYRQRIAQAKAQRDADELKRRAEAAARAGAIWGNAATECNGHPYLEQKHIGAHAARLYRGLLVVPVLDLDGTLHSLQFIDQSGGKNVLTDGRAGGCCYPIGELVDANIILVAEGFATAASLYEATDYPVVAAFNAGNLVPVAQAIRQRFRGAKIVIAADDDYRTKGNPGLTKAREAAALVGGVVAIPDFGSDRPDGFKDFNDLAFFAGHDRVRDIIDAALIAPAGGGMSLDDSDTQEREAEAHETSVDPLYVINPAKWQGSPVPERRWIVPWWIPFGVVSGLYGPPGHGKTLIMQQLMTATALGKPWLGQAATRVKSIAFLCEDDEDELHRRQEEINRHYGCDYADLSDHIRLVPRLGYDNVMMTFKDGRPVRTPFYDQVLSEALSFGAQLALIDTVADTFGGDQNNMGHARQYVQGLAAIAREIKGGLVAAAHPSQHGKSSGSGESGSVQWDAAFRSRAYLDMPKPEDGEAADDDARILSRVKANYARKGETIPLRWQDGVFISTAAPTGIIGSIQRKTCERIVLDFVEQMTKERQWVSINKKAGNYAPRVFMQRPPEARQGYKTSDFERAIQDLLFRGELVNQPYGRKSDERYRLARANGVNHDSA